MDAAPLAVSLAYCAAASAFDFRERRIPDFVNYSAMAFATAIAWMYSLDLVSYAVYSAYSFVFAYTLYRLGVWAGGDAKFFTAACMLLSIDGPSALVPISLFLIAALVSIPLALALGGLALRKTVPMGEVAVGDIPATSYYMAEGRLVAWEPLSLTRAATMLLGGRLSMPSEPSGRRIASSLAARGLSAAEISALKAAGVTQLAIRRTVAFAPSMAIAYAILALGASQWVRAVRLL